MRRGDRIRGYSAGPRPCQESHRRDLLPDAGAAVQRQSPAPSSSAPAAWRRSMPRRLRRRFPRMLCKWHRLKGENLRDADIQIHPGHRLVEGVALDNALDGCADRTLFVGVLERLVELDFERDAIFYR